MKRQIRRNVFETNSSSTHAICISKNTVDKTHLPAFVTFTHGEFGWEFAVHEDTWTKASYLYQAIYECYDVDEIYEKLNRIVELLNKYDINCEFQPQNANVFDNGYIDHGCETIDFVNAVLEDGDKLITYLFGDSFVVTGNDNSDDFSDYMYDNDGHYNYCLKPKFDNYEIFEKWN